ncbi:MAG: hypothetical protein EOP39_03365 [Rubrivivax sp.]|nr:MAG: hypothetical protein EOP39_03365 [Rubrivivax sp.]
MKAYRSTALRCFTACCLAVLSACGGSDNSPADPPPVVVAAPAVSAQPQDATALAGANVAFTVQATGSAPLSYQWLRDGVVIPAATEATLSLAASVDDQGRSFSVRVANSAGSVTSAAVKLTVLTEDKDPFAGASPTVQLSNPSPGSGEAVSVTLDVADATSLRLVPSGAGCGSLSTTQLSGTRLSVNGVVANEGLCTLTADVSRAGGITTYTNAFTVVPRTLAAQGFSFRNGSYLPSGEFEATASGAAYIAALEVPQSFINGGSGVVYATVGGAGATQRMLFKIAGIPGYFVAKGTPEGARLRFDVEVSPRFMKDGSAPRQRTLTAQPIDSQGALGAALTRTASFQRVGSGPLQVSLSFDGNDDLDLHVVTPAGTDVYYGNRANTGGSLDLDSNSGCSIDYLNNENVVWPVNSSPAAGTYSVRVALYQSCSKSPVNFTVKVSNCGTVTSYTGAFTAADQSAGGAGSGRVVADIPFVPCGLSVSGRATYDDYVPTISGLSATARSLPIRRAKVEVRAVAGDALLGKGSTDENGDYLVDFRMETPGAYYVKVLAEQDDTAVRQRVVNDKDELYSAKSAPVDATQQATAVDVNIVAGRASSFAEAFNIFDLGVSAFREVSLRTGELMTTLTWEWTSGGNPACRTTCYVDAKARIHVLSAPADEDAYDDSVLAHQFGHFFLQQHSAENSMGGKHSSAERSEPRLAWSEGAALFVGQQVLRQAQYLDTNVAGARGLNLEQPGEGIPSGTDDGATAGKVSEATVAALLWDLADGAQDSASQGATAIKDTLVAPHNVFGALKAMRGATFRSPGNPTLVDFLDKYICLGHATWESSAGSNFRGLVSVLNAFPYSPTGAPACAP